MDIFNGGLLEGMPFAVWALVHAAGLTVACLSRMSLGRRMQVTMQMAMAMSIVLVAGLAINTDLAASLAWVASAATIGVMVIAAVWEPVPQFHDPMLMRVIAAHE